MRCVAILDGLLDKSSHGFDAAKKQIRQRAFQVAHAATGGGANVENRAGLQHTQECVHELGYGGVRGAFVCMHGIIASGSIRVIFPLSLYSATRFDDHATSLPARVRKVKSKAYRTELVAAIFFSAAHSKRSHNSAPLRSHVHCLAVRTAASAMRFRNDSSR